MESRQVKYPHFVKVLVYANIFIALCAASQVVLTQCLFNIPFSFTSASYVLFIALSTYVQYNMQKGYVIAPDNVNSERSQWTLKHRKTLLISNFVCLIVLLFLCNNLSWTAIGIMAGAEILSALYYLPQLHLRKYGYVKPFLTAAIWTISCGLVPLIENKLLHPQDSYFLVAQFCFISALGLLFDVKDAVADYMNGTNTFANKFGATFSKILAALFILSNLFLFFGTGIGTKVANAAIMVLSLLLCFASTEKKQSFFYTLYIDGLILWQAIAICAVLISGN